MSGVEPRMVACKTQCVIQTRPFRENKMVPSKSSLLPEAWGLMAVLVGIISWGSAAPMPAPDFALCQPGYFYPLNVSVECCPVLPQRKVKSFTFEEYGGKQRRLRVRRPAHRLDAAYWEKYNRAYQLLQELPDDDPRSHVQQRFVHCAYCDATFPMPWGSGDPTTPFVNPTALYPNETLQVHYGWLLFPWHRWFLYFHERILASLLGDEDFALPFWNWDNQNVEPGFHWAPSMMPQGYVSGEYPFLAKANRSEMHQPPAVVDLRFNPFHVQLPLPALSDDEIRESNLAILHQAFVNGATTADLFLGRPVRAGDATRDISSGGQGLPEAGPHDVVHLWTGSEKVRYLADMGTFFYSARDPMFFAHHGNLDRIWNVWKELGGWRRDPEDPDFLQTEFVFYDENKDLVKVRVGDGLDTWKLGYTYEEVADGDARWISFNATPCSDFKTPRQKEEFVDSLPEWKDVKKQDKHRGRTSYWSEVPLTVRVKRPKRRHRSEIKDEALILEGVQVDWSKAAHFQVFLMLANASSSADCRVTCAEFTGLFTTVPRTMYQELYRHKRVTFKLGIGNKLKQLAATHLSQVAVTILPGRQHYSSFRDASPLRISRIKIRHETLS